MRERINKPQYQADFKTFNSQQSCIDVFSKVQSLFLEKFFRYNISDYFSDNFSRLDDQQQVKNGKNKKLNQLSALSFVVNRSIQLKYFESKMNAFYSSRSKCQESGEFSYCFRHIYSNVQQSENIQLKERELVVVQVKIKAQIQKIQCLPTLFYKELQLCRLESMNQPQGGIIDKLKAYNKEVIHLFLVYYGDVNFYNFNKQNYIPTKINFFNHQVLVKIHIFYVSRIAMLETFKKISKIQRMDYINDILIQLYEFKREKLKAKKKKQSLQNAEQKLLQSKPKRDILKIIKWTAVASVSGITIGTLIFKLFF